MAVTVRSIASLTGLLAAVLTVNQGVAEDKTSGWHVITARPGTNDPIACELRSPKVEGIYIRLHDRFALVADGMFDDLSDEMGWQVDRYDFRQSLGRDRDPHLIWMSMPSGSHGSEVKKMIREFIRGLNVEVTVYTIFDGHITANISLRGFSQAYKEFVACGKTSAPPSSGLRFLPAPLAESPHWRAGGDTYW